MGTTETENHRYPVTMEVAGPLAIFTRPDTGSTPTSYPAPTWSASKGMFESIAFLSDGAAWICPTKVEICRRIGEPSTRMRFQKYTTNYGGPLRKRKLVSEDNNMQFFATVLYDVCFRLHGAVVGQSANHKVNPRHYLKELFDRRLRQGRCFRTPCLGWSEFTCSYWGPFREGITELDTSISMEIPSMLFSIWGSPVSSVSSGLIPVYSPKFKNQDTGIAKVENGVLNFAMPEVAFSETGARMVSDAE